MEFKDDPIAAKATTLLRGLQSKIDINLSGANYNRIWELVYGLVKDADQETAPLKIVNGRMSDTINALIRSGSEKDTEISRLKQRLADCERKRLTGDRI